MNAQNSIYLTLKKYHILNACKKCFIIEKTRSQVRCTDSDNYKEKLKSLRR